MRNTGFKIILVHCIYCVVKFLSAVPARMGVSEKIAPEEIVSGRKLDAKEDLRVRFGAYIKTSRDEIITNDMPNRTHPCISLGPSGNMQGSLKCFDLLTREVVICRNFKEFPYTHRYITLANSWGKSSCAREYGNKLKLLY